MNKYVELFGKVSISKIESNIPQRTPTKQHTNKNLSFKTKTPRKRDPDIQIRQSFGPTKSPTINRQTTPTKSNYLHKSYAYTNQKVGIKKGVDKNSIYHHMGYFKSKRVESY